MADRRGQRQLLRLLPTWHMSQSQASGRGVCWLPPASPHQQHHARDWGLGDNVRWAVLPSRPCLGDIEGAVLMCGMRQALLPGTQCPGHSQSSGRSGNMQLRHQGSHSMLPAATRLPQGPPDGMWGKPMSGPHIRSSSRKLCLSCRPQLLQPAITRACKAEHQPQGEQGLAALPCQVQSTGAPASSEWPPAQAQDRFRAASGEAASGGPGPEGHRGHCGSHTAAAVLTTNSPA